MTIEQILVMGGAALLFAAVARTKWRDYRREDKWSSNGNFGHRDGGCGGYGPGDRGGGGGGCGGGGGGCGGGCGGGGGG